MVRGNINVEELVTRRQREEQGQQKECIWKQSEFYLSLVKLTQGKVAIVTG